MNTKKLIPCVQCGNQISYEAKTCPKCRHKQGEPQKKIMCYCCDKEIKYPKGVTLEKKGVIHEECKQIISEYSSIYSLDSREGKSNRLYKHEFPCSLCEHENIFFDQAHRVHLECSKCGHPKTSKLPQRSYDKHCIHCGFMLNEFADDSMVLQRLSLGTFIHVICCPPHLKSQREEPWLKKKELEKEVIDPELSLLSSGQRKDFKILLDELKLFDKKSQKLTYHPYTSDGENSERVKLMREIEGSEVSARERMRSLLRDFLSKPDTVTDKEFLRKLEAEFSWPKSEKDKPHDTLRKLLRRISYKQLTDHQKLQLKQIENKLYPPLDPKTQTFVSIVGFIAVATVVLVILSPFLWFSYKQHQIQQAEVKKMEQDDLRTGQTYANILLKGGPVMIREFEKVNTILGTNFSEREEVVLTVEQLNKLKSSTNTSNEQIMMWYERRLKPSDAPLIFQLIDPLIK